MTPSDWLIPLIGTVAFAVSIVIAFLIAAS